MHTVNPRSVKFDAEFDEALEKFVQKKRLSEDTSVSREIRKAVKKHIRYQPKLKTA